MGTCSSARGGWKLRGSLIYLLGIAVSILSSLILMGRINGREVNQVPIYLYDIWWPPLLIWMTVGFTDIALTILRVEDEVVRALADIGMVILLIAVAINGSPVRDFAHPWTRIVWAAAAILLLIPTWSEVRKPARTLKAKGGSPGQTALLSHLKQNLQMFFHIERQQTYTLLSLGLIVIGVVVLLTSPSYIGVAPGIIVVLIGWGFMTEIATDGWFHDLYRDYKSGEWFAENGSIDEAALTLRNGMRTTGERLGKIFSLPTNWTAVIKLLVLVILLVAVNEIQNRGKTIIQPFQAIGFQDTAALMNSANDRLINDLSILNQELQPIIIFPTSSGAVKKRIDYVQAGNISSFEASLNNSGEFELGTVRIPANVLVSPVQGLVRPWLKVRMVNGSYRFLERKPLCAAREYERWRHLDAEPTTNEKFDLQQDLPDLSSRWRSSCSAQKSISETMAKQKDWQAFLSFR